MSKAIRTSITEAFGFEPVLINSALVSAQNRQRLYWVGKRNADGTYSKVNVEQPEDRGILLRDILETGEDLTGNDKSFCLTSTYGGAVPWNTIERSQRDMVAEPVRVGCMPSPDGEIKNSQGMRVYSVGGKSVNLTAQGGGLGAKTGLYAVPRYVGEIPDKGVYRNGSQPSQQYRVYDTNAKGVAVTTCAITNVAVPYCGTIDKPIYEVKNGQITIKGKQYPIKLADGYYIIRKLTVRECMRLQTVPEWYEFPASNSQAYKMLGNGWTVEIIAHILKSFNDSV